MVPIVGLAGLVLGIIATTKPGRGGQGAAIILCSVLLAGLSAVYWYDHVLSSQTTNQTTQRGVHEEHGHLVQEVTPEQQREERGIVEAQHQECAPNCVGENEPAG